VILITLEFPNDSYNLSDEKIAIILGEIEMNKNLLTFFICFLIGSTVVFGGNKQYKIILHNNFKIEPATFTQVNEDFVTINVTGNIQQIHLDSIKEVIHIRKSKLIEGAAIGLLTGLTIGIIAAKTTSDKSDKNDINNFSEGFEKVGWVISGTVLGTASGGVIGSFWGVDKRYQVGHLSKNKKQAFFQDIIED